MRYKHSTVFPQFGLKFTLIPPNPVPQKHGIPPEIRIGRIPLSHWGNYTVTLTLTLSCVSTGLSGGGLTVKQEIVSTREVFGECHIFLLHKHFRASSNYQGGPRYLFQLIHQAVILKTPKNDGMTSKTNQMTNDITTYQFGTKGSGE